MSRFVNWLIFIFCVFPLLFPSFVACWVWLCVKDGWRIARIGYREFKEAGRE